MRIEGTMTAIVTPFDADGRIDEDALRALIDSQISAGMDAIVPCGTTGETPTLTTEEYRLVVSTTVEMAGGQIPVIAGSGSNDTRKAVEITRLAKELGADIALVVTPWYNKPGPIMLEAHFRRVAAEGGLPVMLYNVPGRTGINMSSETTVNLSQVENIIAVKEASANMGQIQEIIGNTNPDTFTVLSGDDGLALPMYSVGSHGLVSVAGNIVPEEMVNLRARFLAGDVDGAANLNKRLFPLFQTLFCESNPVPCKVALNMLGRMGPTVRAPLGPLQSVSHERVRLTLSAMGLL
jgi:4-hydroxy-tetrahydrodipicolinate synthase